MQGADGFESRRHIARLFGLVMVLGLVLGMLAMHSTPMTGMNHGMRPASASSPSASADQPSPMVHSVATAGDTTIAGDGGSTTPPQEHMLQPCLSDSTRSPHAGFVGEVALASPDQPARARTVLSATPTQQVRHPPDLHELCISRT